MKKSETVADTLYLRQHGWCHCERSFNTSKGDFEGGVSVYQCNHNEDGKWTGTGTAFSKRERSYKGQQRKDLGGQDAIWYLVSGEKVGTGGDGEPLVKNVCAQKVVAWDGCNFFVEESVVNGSQWSDHEGYPNCTCLNMDDMLKQT